MNDLWREASWREEVLARARISAAAPDLLNALKDARATLASCADDTAGTPTEAFFLSKVKCCDMAIAKAEGR